MSFQFGNAPPKRLSDQEREAISTLLQKPPAELVDMFNALETIITANSDEAKPLVDSERRDNAREMLDAIRKSAEALQLAIGGARKNQQVMLRIILGSTLTGPNGEPPIGDFSTQLARFCNMLKDIDDALAPPGNGAKADRLRVVAYLCAIQYRKAIGEAPAKRQNGIFRRLMDIVLAPIGLKLPKDPYNILSPAIDAAEQQQPPL